MTEQIVARGTKVIKLLEQFRAVFEVRRLAMQTLRAYYRVGEKFLQVHHDRTGHGIQPRGMGEGVQTLLTPLAVMRPLAKSTRTQALAAVLLLKLHVVWQPLCSLEAVRVSKPA